MPVSAAVDPFSVKQSPKESRLSFMEKMKLSKYTFETGIKKEQTLQKSIISCMPRHGEIKRRGFNMKPFIRDALYRIALYAKNQQVTVNSVLTAFARASRA